MTAQAPLATIIDLTTVFVQLRIPSREFGKIRVGTQIEVRLESVPDHVFEGHVERISGQADPLTGNVVVFGLVNNDNHLLRPGLTCQTRLSLPEVPNTIAIPVTAVADHSGKPVVTLIRQNKAYETIVDTGIETHEYIQILEGLSAHDVVATSGGYGLPSGCPVTITGHADESDDTTP